MAPRPSTLSRRTSHRPVVKLKTNADKAMSVVVTQDRRRIITLDRGFVEAIETVYLAREFNQHDAKTLVSTLAGCLKGRKLPKWDNAAIEAALNHLEDTNPKIKLPLTSAA